MSASASHRAGIVAALLLALLAISPAAAHAEREGRDSDVSELVLGFRVIELLVPDIRAEITPAAETPESLVLSVPFAFYLGKKDLGRRYFVSLAPFAEGQYQFAGDAFRLILGGRSLLASRRSSRALAIDYGAVFGSDGHGGMVGLGPVGQYADGRIHMGLIVRGTRTSAGYRADAVFDFHFAL